MALKEAPSSLGRPSSENQLSLGAGEDWRGKMEVSDTYPLRAPGAANR
jgi:hypothetical protein